MRLTRALGVLTSLVMVSCASGHGVPPVAGPGKAFPPVTATLVPSSSTSAASLPPTSLPAASPASYGPFAVVTEDLALTDPARHRTLPTRIYLPSHGGVPAVADGPFPIFVWSHGLDATVLYFDAILRSWAARGYVVVAPTFPLTRAGAPGGPRFADYVSQPADVSFVITEVLSRDGPSGSERPGLVDPARIGAGGHSLGAVTTAGLVANRCCLDTRVRAAVAVDGAPLDFPGGAAVQRGTALLLIHGDADTTFPVQGSRDTFSTSLPPKYLIVLHGAPHTAFGIPRARDLIVDTVVDFLDLYLKRRSAAGAQLTTDGTVAGFAIVSADP